MLGKGGMGNDNVALKHLLQAMEDIHTQSKEGLAEAQGIEVFEFSNEDLKEYIAALWIDRYTSSRVSFQDAVSKSVEQKLKSK